MLYIIRHGLTDWNKYCKLQGQTDIALNDEGRKMAEKAAREYADVHFDICFSSPLVRAYETAEILLSGRNVPIVTDDRLKEMCFGIYEGLENYRQVRDCPIDTLFRHPEDYVIPAEDGESFEQLFKRTGDFLDEKVKPLLEQGKDVVIVGHGAMNSSIVCQIMGLSLDQFWSAGIENCKLKKLL